MRPRLLPLAWRALACLTLSSTVGAHVAYAQTTTPSVDELVAWLDQPSRQWLATAELQRVPDAAIPRLLDPRRAVLGPHGTLSPALLALAKIGEPAVAPIVERARAILRKDERSATDVFPLIHLLGAIGPPAIPALVDLSVTEPDGMGLSALAPIVQMEPQSNFYGQVVSSWFFWRPAGDDSARIERAIVPLLPRIEKALDRELERQDPQRSSVRYAAYLLARWGGPSHRARGLQVLEEQARFARFFYDAIEVIRDLYVLKAPSTASLIRLTAPRVTRGTELSAAYLLSMAVTLQRLGERDYGDLVDEAIRTGRPYDRIEAAAFLGQTGDLSNVPRLIAMLDDRARNGRVVGDVALEALRRLTLEDLPADRDAWVGWSARHRDAQYGAVLEKWIAGARRSMNDVPIWVANDWIRKISTGRDPRVLPIVAEYLRRPDLAASATGPNSSTGGGGDGPNGKTAPSVVTLLLRLAKDNVTDAIDLLEACSTAADPEVRAFGAMALAAYRPDRAIERLALELQAPDAWWRSEIAELLLMLGDGRGIPARIDALELGGALFGQVAISAEGKTDDLSRGVRMSACLDLRLHTQQPLPCNPNATGDVAAQQAEAWRAWWNSAGGAFTVKPRQARLDRELMYQIHPVTIGESVAR